MCKIKSTSKQCKLCAKKEELNCLHLAISARAKRNCEGKNDKAGSGSGNNF